ncbi:MAG: metal ABC transporter solute-binding protein, Zn/Mn family [Spirochaetota bacterium]
MGSRTLGIFILLTVLVAGVMTACSKEESTPETEKTAAVSVAVSILPQKTFIEKIAGDLAEVVVMVPPDQNPSNYEPTTHQLQQLSRADVYFTIGVPFEQSFVPLLKENLPDLTIVPTDTRTQKRRFRTSHLHDEDEEESEEQAGAVDPHIWMSPVSVIGQAQIMTETLLEIDPAHRNTYEAGLKDFTAELNTLDQELAAALEPLQGETLLVYHPAFGYFADRYGLVQKAVEVGGKEPTPKEIEKLIRTAREDEVSVIFVQPEFNEKSAEVIADAVGAEVVEISSLQADYIENLRDVADILTQ